MSAVPGLDLNITIPGPTTDRIAQLRERQRAVHDAAARGDPGAIHEWWQLEREIRKLIAESAPGPEPPPTVGFGEQAGVTFEDFAAGRIPTELLPVPAEIKLPERPRSSYSGPLRDDSGRVWVPPDTLITLPNGAVIAAGVLVMGGAAQTYGQLTGATVGSGLDHVPVSPDTIIVRPGQAPTTAGAYADESLSEYAAQRRAEERAAERRRTERYEELLTGKGVSTRERDAFATLSDILNSYGLGSLSKWLWSQVINGREADEVLRELRQTDVYKARFPGMELLRRKGLPVPTEAEYLAYEQQVRQIFRDAGMPTQFYDQPADIAYLMGQNLSVQQVAERVQRAFVVVAQAPEPVRQAFGDLFGPRGDAALAAYVFDPERAAPSLEKEVAMATVTGAGRIFGIETPRDVAAELAAAGVQTFGEAATGFAEIAAKAPLFSETITEREDLAAEKEGISEAFGVTGQPGAARTLIQRRLQERQAAVSGGGGFVITQRGMATGEAL